MNKLQQFFENLRVKMRIRQRARQYAESGQFAENLFNITQYKDAPVITYNHVVITPPDPNVSGDELIRKLIELRQIYKERL